MKVLAIIESNVSDPSWIEEYTNKVTPMLTEIGAKYITRTDKVDLLEGSRRPQFSVVVEFPSKDIALNFYHSEEYKPFKEARLKGASGQFLLVNIENAS